MNEQLFSGLTTAAGIGGNVLSTWMANRANMKLAQYSYDQQKQMIQEQNEYNSPLQQMKRYEEAGLNPALIYGNGASSAGNQQSLARYDAPDIKAPQVDALALSEAVKSAMQVAALKADLDIKHQEFENLKEEQFRIRADRHAKDIDNAYNAFLTGFDPGLVTQAGDAEKIRDSSRFKRYSADLMSVEAMTAYRNSAKALVDINREVNKLTKSEKQYYLDNIQPLLKEIMEKRRDGLDVSNELLTLQKKFFTADKIANYSNMLVNAIAKFITPSLNLGGGNPSPSNRSELGSYTMDSYDLPGL